MRMGVDIISVKRIEQVLEGQGDRFLDRIFTREEQAICGSDVRRLAGRFAAKEAVAKALGTGIGRQGIAFSEIEVCRDDWGAPQVILRGAARKRFEALGGRLITLSLSHENDYALAFCVLLTGEEGEVAAYDG